MHKNEIKCYVIRMPIEMSFVSLSLYLVAWICTNCRVLSVKIAHVDLMRLCLPLYVTPKILHTLVIYGVVVELKTLTVCGTMHMVNHLVSNERMYFMFLKIKCHPGIYSVDSHFIKLLHYPYNSNRVNALHKTDVHE